MATAQSQIAPAFLIQFEFIYRKPVTMHEFHDDWVRDGIALPLPVVTARVDCFIAEGGKGPLPRYGVSTSRSGEHAPRLLVLASRENELFVS